MKRVFAEYLADYPTYSFGYSVYAVRDPGEPLAPLYAAGFLPYSADVSLDADIYYLARSLRVDLDRFRDTSENRRVDRKAAILQPRLDVTPVAEFDTGAPDFRRFCLSYAEERFQAGRMDSDRLNYVLGRNCLTHVFTVTAGQPEATIGYVLGALGDECLHYWYSFLDTRLLSEYSVGKWLMWRTIRWAAEVGLSFVYLGTCYGVSALYKVRDHTGCEFYDGGGWCRDLTLLKQLCALDGERDPAAGDGLKTAGPYRDRLLARLGIDRPAIGPEGKQHPA